MGEGEFFYAEQLLMGANGVEEVDLLLGRYPDPVLDFEVVEEPGGSGLLGSDAYEIGAPSIPRAARALASRGLGDSTASPFPIDLVHVRTPAGRG
jgi:hypothetical protein